MRKRVPYKFREKVLFKRVLLGKHEKKIMSDITKIRDFCLHSLSIKGIEGDERYGSRLGEELADLEAAIIAEGDQLPRMHS